MDYLVQHTHFHKLCSSQSSFTKDLEERKNILGWFVSTAIEVLLEHGETGKTKWIETKRNRNILQAVHLVWAQKGAGQQTNVHAGLGAHEITDDLCSVPKEA